MSSAVLFAGQAADDLRAALRHVGERPLLAKAARIIDLPVARWLESEHLQRTALAQSIQVALGLTLFAEHKPDDAVVFAGHSLGALTAAAAAGAIEPIDAVHIAAARGRAMAAAARATPGGMVALRIEEDAADVPGLALAARNTPDQAVFSGPHDAIDALLRRRPGKRLAVEGPWHHPMMAAAAEPLRAALADRVRAPRRPVLSGLDGRMLRDPGAIAAALVASLTTPVDWPTTCRAIGRVAERSVIIGPGRALRGLMRQNLPAHPLTLIQRAGQRP